MSDYNDPRAWVRDNLHRYPTNTARTAAALDAALSGNPAPSVADQVATELAALAERIGYTAEDLAADMAAGDGHLTVYVADDGDDWL